MNDRLNWIVATLALTVTAIVLCFYTLHEKKVNADKNMELLRENDSLRSINTYLTIELGKARQQLKIYEKEPALTKISMSGK